MSDEAAPYEGQTPERAALVRRVNAAVHAERMAVTDLRIAREQAAEKNILVVTLRDRLKTAEDVRYNARLDLRVYDGSLEGATS